MLYSWLINKLSLHSIFFVPIIFHNQFVGKACRLSHQIGMCLKHKTLKYFTFELKERWQTPKCFTVFLAFSLQTNKAFILKNFACFVSFSNSLEQSFFVSLFSTPPPPLASSISKLWKLELFLSPLPGSQRLLHQQRLFSGKYLNKWSHFQQSKL